MDTFKTKFNFKLESLWQHSADVGWSKARMGNLEMGMKD